MRRGQCGTDRTGESASALLDDKTTVLARCLSGSRHVRQQSKGRVRPATLAKGARGLVNPSPKGNYMPQGTVKWFNSQKGYGFIQSDDRGQDVFVHISAVERAAMQNLNEGQKVSFDIVTDRRTGKLSADNLRTVR